MNDLNAIKRKLLNPNIKIMVVPIAAIIVLSVASYFVVSAGYIRIASRLEELEEIQSTQNILENKVEALRNIQQGLLDRSDLALIVLPDTNPVMFSISQVKSFLQDSGGVLKSIELRAVDKSGELKKSTLVIVAEYESVGSALGFLKDIKNVAPLSRIKEAEIKNNQNAWQLEAGMEIYWSSLPDKLPPLTEPLVELNNKEKETLFGLSEYFVPQFTKLDPAKATGRSNPFN